MVMDGIAEQTSNTHDFFGMLPKFLHISRDYCKTTHLLIRFIVHLINIRILTFVEILSSTFRKDCVPDIFECS